MSVRIEVLDYKKGNTNLVDTGLGSPQTGWTLSAISDQRADFSGTGLAAGAVKYFNNITPNLINGAQYDIEITISNYSGTGDIGVSSEDSSGTANGIGTTVRGSANGTHTKTFTWTAGSTGIRLFGKSTNAATIDVTLTDDNAVVWHKSIAGALDVTDHSEFPLALTFQISDIKDITSSSGDFSKTFKIPATKNNNKILKQQFNPNVEYDGDPLSIGRKCRILINDFYSLEGLLKINGLGGYGEDPEYYDCVFYGNNLTWAKDIDEKLMSETFGDGHGLWGSSGSGLSYNKNSIVATWSQEHSESGSSPLVYPVVSYGDYNSDGIPYTVQLLDTKKDYWNSTDAQELGYYGFYDAGTNYGTPSPASDWRPALWVKTTFEAIFSKVGYNISSNFMDTDEFKKLVWLLPNFKYNNADARYNEYGIEYKWLTERNSTFGAGATAVNTDYSFSFLDASLDENDADTHYTGSSRQSIPFATATATISSGYNLDVILDNSSRLSTTNDEITIGEYGYYDIRFPVMQTKVVTLYKGGSGYQQVLSLDCCINIEIQTTGQSSWNIIGQVEKELVPLNSSNSHNVNQSTKSFTDWQSTGSFNERIWLNKNDKIRFTTGVRLTGTSSTSQNFYVAVAWRATGASNLQVSLDPVPVWYGQTYDLDKVMNKEYKQLDFIKGVAHAFNLVLTTDTVAKTIFIEPFDDFYKTYKDAIDWTQKLDRSKEVKDTWLKTDLKRDIVFKYKSDNKDLKVKDRGERYFDKIHDESPYFETLSDAFERGKSTFENPFFAGTYNAQDSDAGGSIQARPAYSACLWETTVSAGSSRSNTPKGFDFLPRLLSYRKYSPASTIDNRHQVIVQTWANYLEGLTANSQATLSAGGYLSNSIPQATMNNKHSNEMPVLSYGNIWIKNYDENGEYAASVAGKGLFETYYKKMFEMLKTNPRIRTVYVNLKLSDIISLDFRKLVYIDGAYWRINRIMDYQPNKNTVTKVELLYWQEFGSFAASAPAFGSSSNTNWGVGVYANTNDVSEPYIPFNWEG